MMAYSGVQASRVNFYPKQGWQQLPEKQNSETVNHIITKAEHYSFIYMDRHLFPHRHLYYAMMKREDTGGSGSRTLFKWSCQAEPNHGSSTSYAWNENTTSSSYINMKWWKVKLRKYQQEKKTNYSTSYRMQVGELSAEDFLQLAVYINGDTSIILSVILTSSHCVLVTCGEPSSQLSVSRVRHRAMRLLGLPSTSESGCLNEF